VVPNEPVGTDLPVASTCTFTERNVPDGVTVTYAPPNADGTGGEVVIPSEDNVAVIVGITDKFEVGSLIIVKEVSGPGAPEFWTIRVRRHLRLPRERGCVLDHA